MKKTVGEQKKSLQNQCDHRDESFSARLVSPPGKNFNPATILPTLPLHDLTDII